MDKIKNFIIYTIIGGGGSIGLSYLLSDLLQVFAIISLMVLSSILAVKDYISDGESSISFQTTPTRRPEGGDYEFEKNESSSLYFALGVIIFGIGVLVFQLNFLL